MCSLLHRTTPLPPFPNFFKHKGAIPQSLFSLLFNWIDRSQQAPSLARMIQWHHYCTFRFSHPPISAVKSNFAAAYCRWWMQIPHSASPLSNLSHPSFFTVSLSYHLASSFVCLRKTLHLHQPNLCRCFDYIELIRSQRSPPLPLIARFWFYCNFSISNELDTCHSFSVFKMRPSLFHIIILMSLTVIISFFIIYALAFSCISHHFAISLLHSYLPHYFNYFSSNQNQLFLYFNGNLS